MEQLREETREKVRKWKKNASKVMAIKTQISSLQLEEWRLSRVMNGQVKNIMTNFFIIGSCDDCDTEDEMELPGYDKRTSDEETVVHEMMIEFESDNEEEFEKKEKDREQDDLNERGWTQLIDRRNCAR